MTEQENARILFVDDEPSVLEGIRRQLRGHFDVTTAVAADGGLESLRAEGPFAVVVSDYQMPKMNGVEFLARVREDAPETMRIMLTGQADWDAVIQAVNDGNIFRFLTKPCPPEALHKALNDAVEHWRLTMAEKLLLQRTLTGSVKVLTDMLALVHPGAFHRAQRIRRYVDAMVETLGMHQVWQFPVAAMLCQIGCITLPTKMIMKMEKDVPFTAEEREMYELHPKIGRDVLKVIPRLEQVADIVARQFDSVSPEYERTPLAEWPLEALGGQLLHVASGLDDLALRGISEHIALKELAKNSTAYHPMLLALFSDAEVTGYADPEIREVSLVEIETGNLFAEEVRTKDDVLLVGAGQEVTELVIQRLRNYFQRGELVEPLKIRVDGRLEETRT